MDGYICDVCETVAPTKLYPLAWRRIHSYRSTGEEPRLSKHSAADVCSATCAKTAVERMFEG